MKTFYFILITLIAYSGFPLSGIQAQAREYVYNSCSDSQGKFKYSDSFTDYEVQVKGEVKVNDDDTRILSISPGGYLKISKKTFGNRRALIIESNSEGNLSYAYFEGRKEEPFEPEGRKWLADVLLDVIRITGISAKDRTARIYGSKGIEGFLSEIDQISSNSVMGIYFDALLNNHSLNNDELAATCTAISHVIDSNSERGRLFREHGNLFLANNTLAVVFFESISRMSSNTERGSVLRSISKEIDFNDPSVTEAYFSCVDKLSSNTEAGIVLRHLDKTQKLSTQAYTRLLVSVKKLSSNTEMGIIMRSLENLDMENDALAAAWFDALDAMSSNTEAGVTLRHLLKNYDLNKENYARLLSSITKLSSNTEAGSVLRAINTLDLTDPQFNKAYFRAVSSLSSNTESGSVLRHCIETYRMDPEAWSNFFMTTGKLSSNTEMGSVLRKAIPEMPIEKEALDSFFTATNKMSSNTEKGRVLRKLAEDSRLTREAAIGILESSKIMSSNTEKSSILRTVAATPWIKDEAVKAEYMSAARTISSDTEYRRVVDVIVMQ